MCVCVCVLLCFVDPILGNRYGPGVSSFRHWPGVAGSSPFTLTASLVIQSHVVIIVLVGCDLPAQKC